MFKATLIGRLGQNVELRHTQKGTAVANVSIACDVPKKDKPEWAKVTIWGKAAENAAKFLEKGRMVYVEGDVRNEVVEINGEKKYFTKVHTNSVKFLDFGKKNNDTDNTDTKPDTENVPNQADEDDLFTDN